MFDTYYVFYLYVLVYDISYLILLYYAVKYHVF